MNNTITMMLDAYKNDKTGETVPGATIIIDGKLRQVMDIIIAKNDEYTGYLDVVKDAFSIGLEQIANSIRKK